MKWLVLAVALASTAGAQVAYKSFFGETRRWRKLMLALALFGLAQIGFFFALTQLDIGVVYMSMGLTHVAVLVLSATVLGERLRPDHAVAATLICGGLILYAA